jgi:hypothetical protein
MSSARQSDDRAWEKKYAPKIGRGRMIAAVVVFGLWIAFLAYLSIDRWFGALQ